MKVKHQDILINDDGNNPFENCKLDRKKYAEVLTSLVSSYNDGFVMAINSEWGSGKTTFVKMWQQYLKNNAFKTVYFNAWENDYQDDVIIALLSELDEFRDKGAEKFKNVLNNVLPLLKKITPALLKYGVSKAMGDEAVSIIASGVGENTIENLEDSLKEYNEKKSKIQEFRLSLQEFAETVDSEKPVVFIIDELDRCRPNYAVEVLEQMKHLFNVKGVVFVLSIDKDQLGHAVRGVYGSEQMNASEYLRRFIDIEYSLPKPDCSVFCSYLVDYFDLNSFFRSDERLKHREFNDDSKSFSVIATMIFEQNLLNLRQIEKILGHTSIVLRTFKENQYIFPLTLFFMVYLKTMETKIFLSITNKEYDIQELIEVFQELLPNWFNEEGTRYYVFLIAQTLCLYSSHINLHRKQKPLVSKNEKTDKFELNISIENLDDQTESDFIQIINAFFNNFNYGNISLDYVLKRVSLTENFKNLN